MVQYPKVIYCYADLLPIHGDKGAGTSDTPSQTKEELSGNDTSRHPKVLKIGPNHGCQ